MWKWTLMVSGVVLLSLLWVGHDTQCLVQRLNPDEYMLVLVYFYADLGVVAVVMFFIIPLLCCVCQDGGNSQAIDCTTINCDACSCNNSCSLWVPVRHSSQVEEVARGNDGNDM